jgi:two-component system, cell cycle sensor histidine kinase and response regulator CckA
MNAENQQSFDAGIAGGLTVVLLAEDDVILRNLLLLLLQREGYAVLVASDGQEAIELSRAFNGVISLLLTDMDMPRLGGAQLGETIMPERDGIRILQMSGGSAESFVGSDLSLDFIQKPFGPSALKEKIAEVLASPSGTVRRLAKAHAN